MSAEKVRSLLRRILGSESMPSAIILGEVTAVDSDRKTCDIKPEDGGAEVFDVRLRPVVDGNDSGLLLTPTIGAVIAVLMVDDNDGFLLSCSQLESLQIRIEGHVARLDGSGWSFNGGKNGGLVNWPNLLEELNKTKAYVKAIADTLTGWTPVPNDGGAALKTAAAAKLSTLEIGTFENLEDKKVKH